MLSQQPPPVAAGGSPAATGGELRIGTGLNIPSSLDVAQGSTGYNMINYGAGETLMRVTPEQQLQPWLAEEVVQLDATAWQITLRQGVRFHDGSPLTAEAVAASLQGSLTALPGAKNFLPANTTINVMDERTLTLRTPEPAGNLPYSLANWNFVIHRPPQNGISVLTGMYRPVRLEVVALDLACGPGAISQRLLARFPQARTIALDYNPVLLHLGRQTLGEPQSRITWIAHSLADPNWVEPVQAALERLGRPQLDAVLSTTALHWLPIDQLTRVYNQLGALVRPGGLLLNGDNIAYPAALGAFRKLSQGFKDQLHARVFADQGGEDYRAWWQTIERDWLAADPTLQPLFDGYRAIEAVRPRNFGSPIVTVHSAALTDAGFDQVDTIWQRYDNRVLMAVRGEPTAPVVD